FAKGATSTQPIRVCVAVGLAPEPELVAAISLSPQFKIRSHRARGQSHWSCVDWCSVKEEQPATGKRCDGVRMSGGRESGTCLIEGKGSVDVDDPGVDLCDQVRHLNSVALRAQQ